MKMMALAGEIADGVLLNYLVGPAYNREAMAALAEGAARAGRTVDDVDRPQLVVCSLDDDRSLALDRARELVDPVPRPAAAHHEGERRSTRSLLEEIGAVLTWPATAEQIERAMHLVPDEVVQLITASGTRRRVPRQGARVRRERLHLPDPLSARRRRAGDDRRVRDGGGVTAALLPKTLEEAVAQKRSAPNALAVAGGTDVMVAINSGALRPSALLDLSHVRELQEWHRDDGHVFVGAGVTFARIAGELTGFRPLVEAARAVGSPQIRRRATLGGNVGTASPAGDGLAVLAAYDADILLASEQGERRLHWDEYLVGPKRTALRPDELIVGVEWAAADGPGSFAKVGTRNAMVIAIASVALQLDVAIARCTSRSGRWRRPWYGRRPPRRTRLRRSPGPTRSDRCPRRR